LITLPLENSLARLCYRGFAGIRRFCQNGTTAAQAVPAASAWINRHDKPVFRQHSLGAIFALQPLAFSHINITIEKIGAPILSQITHGQKRQHVEQSTTSNKEEEP
jgi:hypothetical protein